MGSWWTTPLVGRRKSLQEIRGEQDQARFVRDNEWQMRFFDSYLSPGEKMLSFLKGYREIGSKRKSGQSVNPGGGWLIATDQRIIWYAEKVFGRVDTESIFYDKISSVDQSKGFGRLRRVRVYASGNDISVMIDGKIPDEELSSFMNIARERIRSAEMYSGAISSGTLREDKGSSLADDLRQLSELHEEGILSDDEYRDAKQRRLSSAS